VPPSQVLCVAQVLETKAGRHKDMGGPSDKHELCMTFPDVCAACPVTFQQHQLCL
jgi:hypothetical protein